MPIADLSPELAPQLALELGLKTDEYEKVVDILGRTPTITELYMYSLMWSEHCSYKHSRKTLRMFPTDGPHVLQGPGENAGVIRVGDGWAIAFKMESHNHPSAIEPYQGAATGVGGIIRDIFTMGARPIASLDSLRFGTLDKPRQRYLFEGAVAGIGGYGNCLGVPTVGGEVYFEEAYEGNCLINAMAIGLMREDDLTRAVAAGPGNLVVLIGSTTGRDGIGGASTLASQEFDEKAEDKRPSVQVGDPFEEKLLIEACLELLEKDLLVALGDLGAAGLTSSASEMASRGGVGLDIDVSTIPAREEAMKPFEYMVSESQERMLAVVTPDDLDQVHEVCERWGLRSTVIGEVTDTGRFVVREGDDVVADMPAATLAHDAPIYDPARERPAYLDDVQAFDPMSLDHPVSPAELNDVLLRVLASPNICSRSWIWEQYDHQVMVNTVVRPGSDAAVLRIGDTGRGETTDRGIAASTDCNGRYCYLDPYTGAQIAFAEAARNVACTGARPAAITDCLNFGNPEKPEVFWTFHESVRGLADACTAFGVPVISGNVSFYNESFGQPIYPTPTVGLVGVLEDVSAHCTMDFKHEGDAIVMLGRTRPELGGSEYLKVVHDMVAGRPPRIDLVDERLLNEFLVTAIGTGIVLSAHDCSEGGAAVALAECCLAGGLGATVDLDPALPPVAALFSESQARVVLTVDPDHFDALKTLAATHATPCVRIGTVGGDRLTINGLADLSLGDLREAYETTLERLVHGEA
ncbi:phosphoribosylformylglycinamidine synthase subunit PurL [Anaerosoma tenue]|uniref:phosphoribosylformylglycinamidine synthase subunit PurL n=1 Tax=Anaerosoma tenue TaxID=2933588 RepID=UPI002260E4AB|nr:phosphoribosylformylglycinamidine synthase subunit PurL [Anaerosoma tenue]MCK8115021.1 phosphoribosylformylglycinamidine synthase subunit PurL [Anaerosoma tenue]